MKLLVVAVGRLKADYARLGCADFFQRAGRLLPVEVVEVRDAQRGKGGKGGKRGDAERWKAEEAANIRAALPPNCTLVALDERGRTWTSRDFAGWLEAQQLRAVPAVAFVIGGPDGLDPSLRDQADRVWALGPGTMAHELARLVLAEQLYRAASILAGTPYHRD